MKYLITALIVLMFSAPAFAVTEFTWNPNPAAEGVAGYRLYCGTAPSAYTQNKDVGKPAVATDGKLHYPIASFGFTTDGTKYCNITAYDAASNESLKDGEINFPWDKTPPSAVSGFGTI